MDSVIVNRSGLLLAAVFLFATASCKKPSQQQTTSDDHPPGGELAGTYLIQPSHQDESIEMKADGEVVYKIGTSKRQTGLAYKNQFRLIIFLDDQTDPSGFFILTDRTDTEWPGYWNQEVRFLNLQSK